MDFGKDLWLIPKQSNSWLQTDAETESQGYIAEPCSAYIAKAALKPTRRALQDLAHSRPFATGVASDPREARFGPDPNPRRDRRRWVSPSR